MRSDFEKLVIAKKHIQELEHEITHLEKQNAMLKEQLRHRLQLSKDELVKLEADLRLRNLKVKNKKLLDENKRLREANQTLIMKLNRPVDE